MLPKLRVGPWKLDDLKKVKKNGLKVFSTFACGGGSTMGYKLAGYDVLGCCEIDPEMLKLYWKNHNPSFTYGEPIQEFNKRKKDTVHGALFDLDILDGSPPCSSFSISGSREDKWGEAHKFREGQALQILDDLFFHFIKTAEMLRPKIAIAENVKGLILGMAKGYVLEIQAAFKKAGYDSQLFVFNSARMGVPQTRERTFFIARRRDLKMDPVKFSFNERPITADVAIKGCSKAGSKKLEPFLLTRGAREWCFKRHEYRIEQWRIKTQGKPGYFNHVLVLPGKVAPTQTASIRHIHWASDRRLSDSECVRLQTFPDDYDFLDSDAGYVCGMSVPPFMMQRVADQVARQCFGLR